MMTLCLLIVLAPLAGALISGFFGRQIGRRATHYVAIAGVTVSTVISAQVLYALCVDQINPFNQALYSWLTVAGFDFSIGFLVDKLTALMLVVVTSVSLMVHIYTIGYMKDDPGYQRFFSYISLFTFAMLMLVMSNNFVQLFFGWEAVGLVSYLLIGFWFKKSSATFANLKAFIVNRVGDLGFLLGIGLILAHFGGTLNYSDVFAAAPALKDATISILPHTQWSLLSVTCILLFIGAMGKSAQFPLHVWLPDSMEGPTPISALIHAATMVTAGIFMVARMSPLFELSDTALSFVMIIGAITALFMGFVAVVQNDIKRVVAYSTLSQLGYMTIALGASAYSIAIFHVMTHAFFKALLFLAAGSVIISMKHEQDMRNMGGLRRHMPITWITSLIGSLALVGMPFFSGFYSKDLIIEAEHSSMLSGSNIAYFAALVGVFVTAFYTFRMYFMVFHGKERWHETSKPEQHNGEEHHGLKAGETPKERFDVLTLPLILLAIPSALLGLFSVKPLLAGGFFDGSIQVDVLHHPALHELQTSFHGALAMGFAAISHLPFWLMLFGIALAWLMYIKKPTLPALAQKTFRPIYVLLERKYYLDEIYYLVFVKGAHALGTLFWKVGDVLLIDGLIVNGCAHVVEFLSRIVRKLQTGFIYGYATTMIIGVLGLLTFWFVQIMGFWK